MARPACGAETGPLVAPFVSVDHEHYGVLRQDALYGRYTVGQNLQRFWSDRDLKMSENFDPNLTYVLLLGVVAFIFYRLWSVLGRRTGNERPRYDTLAPDAAAPKNGPERESGKIIPLPRASTSNQPVDAVFDDVESRLKPLSKDSRAWPALEHIARADPSFSADGFLKGANVAYEMIVTAYAKGDRETLRGLLSKDVFDGFTQMISERQARGETTDFSFVGITSSSIVDAHLEDRMAHVTVRFVCELITAVRNRAGEVIDGDPKAVRDVTDIWTFMRDVTSANPNWRLVATDTPE